MKHSLWLCEVFLAKCEVCCARCGVAARQIQIRNPNSILRQSNSGFTISFSKKKLHRRSLLHAAKRCFTALHSKAISLRVGRIPMPNTLRWVDFAKQKTGGFRRHQKVSPLSSLRSAFPPLGKGGFKHIPAANAAGMLLYLLLLLHIFHACVKCLDVALQELRLLGAKLLPHGFDDRIHRHNFGLHCQIRP